MPAEALQPDHEALGEGGGDQEGNAEAERIDGEQAGSPRDRSPAGLMRALERTVITTYGRDFGVASTLFRRDSAAGKIGRQMQTWLRTDAGWRVVAAHVSIIADPDSGGGGR